MENHEVKWPLWNEIKKFFNILSTPVQFLANISAIVGVMAVIIAVSTYRLNESTDLYNRKISRFSYEFERITNTETSISNSPIKFKELRTNFEIEAKSPSIIVMKIASGMPIKRKVIIMDDELIENSQKKIQDIISLHSQEQDRNYIRGDLALTVTPTVTLPAYKLDFSKYISYYFVYSEGVDGTKYIDCVFYYIKSKKRTNEAFISYIDMVDLELRKFTRNNENGMEKEDMDLIEQFFNDKIVENYSWLKQRIKDSKIE